MPSSVAVMISDEVTSASGLFRATGKLETRLKYSAALAETVVASRAAVSAVSNFGEFIWCAPLNDGSRLGPSQDSPVTVM